MCEAEEILRWLCEELKQKQKEHSDAVKGVVGVLQHNVNFEDMYEQMRAIDAVNNLEPFSDELSGIVREAKLRMKEAKGQVAA